MKQLILLVALTIGANAATNAQTALKSSVDSLSYAIGIMAAADMAKKAADVAGFNNDLASKAMMEFQKDPMKAAMKSEDASRLVQKHSRELAMKANEANKAAGLTCLTVNEKKKGVTKTASGLQYEVLKSGDAAGAMPKTTDKVKVHYHGMNIDGSVFDSSVDRGTPAEFGVTQVIKGWTEVLQLMHVGDKWKVTIPQELAYGERGAGAKIKPYSTLIFDIELLGINDPATAPAPMKEARPMGIPPVPKSKG